MVVRLSFQIGFISWPAHIFREKFQESESCTPLDDFGCVLFNYLGAVGKSETPLEIGNPWKPGKINEKIAGSF